MMKITRLESSDYGTFGILALGGFRCFSLEPPWRGNAQGLSCIPAGDYMVEPWSSKTYRQALHITNVPGREGILVHQGNWAGDKLIGLRCNSNGCVLVGQARGVIIDQPGIAASLLVLAELCKFFEALKKEKIPLEVRDVA
ncbi:MAG: DUF5675 family protein [Desulfovibrionaceae bacterium]|nr:DUF5675 family protein [Desulfovibrionaceae bacterium]